MKNKIVICVMTVIAVITVPALADPVQVQTASTPIQDDWNVDGWVEELSTNPWNPAAQLIASQEVAWEGHVPCLNEYEGGGAVQVQITNLTNRYFDELYYVGDVDPDDGIGGTSFSNYDEAIRDMSNPSPYYGLAFKIDAVGENTPLVFESMTQDQIFEPGEIWEFVIQEYSNSLGLGPALLGSVGQNPYGAVAAASWGDVVSSGSIITPEPTTLCLLGLGGLTLLRKRK